MRRAIPLICLGALLTALLALTPGSAQATPWDPNVGVTVRVKCGGPGTYKLTVQSPSIGTKTVNSAYSGAYRTVIVRLSNVPKGSGTTLSYNLTCSVQGAGAALSGSASGRWGIARPAVGTNVNKVVCGYRGVSPCYF